MSGALSQQAIVIAESERFSEAAADLATGLGLEVMLDTESEAASCCMFRIEVGHEIAVLSGFGKNKRRVLVDFSLASLRQRVQSGGKDLLIRACGLHKAKHPIRKVIDATAGFGGDAWVLAAQGVDVLAIEQDPLVAALLQNALQRALVQGLHGAQNLTFMGGNSMLVKAQSRVDIVYIDPMFSAGRRSAASSKSMSFLQDWLASRYSEERQIALFDWALSLASYRVVVKRALKAEWLSSHAPTFQIKGKTHRFDVYQVGGGPL
jgi:16S rRNA (guanine1516-N2)-methyltransferase